MSNPQANERTALSEGPARYDATLLPAPTGTSADAATLPDCFVPRSNRSPLARLAVAVGALSAMFLVAVLLSSAVRVASTPGDGASEDLAGVASTTIANGDDGTEKIIPSMQPFSTVDPANAHCPHMDRPEVGAQDGYTVDCC